MRRNLGQPANAEVDQLATEFRELIIRKRELSEQPRLGNKLVPRMLEVRTILASSSEGRAAVSAMMRDPDDGIKLAGASWSLPWDERKAVRVLKRLMRGNSMAGFTAKYVLKGHFEGTRTYDGVAVGTQAHSASGGSVAEVSEADLDAAFSLNSLALNGGLDHAYEGIGDQFPKAIAGFRGAGRPDIADLVSQFLQFIGPSPEPDDLESRAVRLAARAEAAPAELDRLVEAYGDAPDPQQDIERAGSTG